MKVLEPYAARKFASASWAIMKKLVQQCFCSIRAPNISSGNFTGRLFRLKSCRYCTSIFVWNCLCVSFISLFGLIVAFKELWQISVTTAIGCNKFWQTRYTLLFRCCQNLERPSLLWSLRLGIVLTVVSHCAGLIGRVM